MSKNKKGFFGKLKSKFSKKNNLKSDQAEEDFEIDDSTLPNDPLEEASFEFENSDDESQIEEQLLARKDMPSKDILEDEEDEEDFEIQDFSLSGAQKENIDQEIDSISYQDQTGEFNFQEVNLNTDQGEKVNKKGKSSFLSYFKKKRNRPTKKSKRNENSKFALASIISLLFLPSSRPRIHRWFLISTTIVFFFIFGKALAIFIQTQLPKRRNINTYSAANQNKNLRNELQKIASTNLFNAKKDRFVIKRPEVTPKVKGPKAPTICYQADKTSSLPIKLLTTLVLQDSVKSVASVQIRGKHKLKQLREGDKIDNIAHIGRITGSKLIFKNLRSGLCEYVYSGKKDRSSTALKKIKIVSAKEGKKILEANRDKRILMNGNKFKIKKSFRDEMLGKMSSILTQARAIPVKNSDGTLSFKVVDIQPGSVYAQLNIQDGDIINTINGNKIQNVNEVMNLFGRFKDISAFQIGILRSGAQEKMEYSFE